MLIRNKHMVHCAFKNVLLTLTFKNTFVFTYLSKIVQAAGIEESLQLNTMSKSNNARMKTT